MSLRVLTGIGVLGVDSIVDDVRNVRARHEGILRLHMIIRTGKVVSFGYRSGTLLLIGGHTNVRVSHALL